MCPSFLAVFAVLLLAAELLLRRQDPRARDVTGDGTQLPTATQRLHPRALRGAWRIVVLGDSIPFGWPLAHHDGYPARLEALLRQRKRTRPVAVINAAIGGHTAVMGLARVERDLVRWRPHVALIAFGLNDCHLARTPLDERRERAMYAAERPLNRLRCLLARSALLVALASLRTPYRLPHRPPRGGDKRGGRGGTHAAQDGVERVEGAPRVSPNAYAHALRALLRAARRAGAQPYLLTMTPLGPSARRGPGGWSEATYDEYTRILRAVAAEQQAPVIDVGRAFPTGGDLAPLLAADGIHLTAAGQSLLAQTIAEALSSS